MHFLQNWVVIRLVPSTMAKDLWCYLHERGWIQWCTWYSLLPNILMYGNNSLPQPTCKAWINQHPQTHQFSPPHSSYGLWMKPSHEIPFNLSFFPIQFFWVFSFFTFPPPFFFSSPHFFLLLSSFFYFFFSSSFFFLLHFTYPTHQHPLVFIHHCHPPIPHACSLATRTPSPPTFTYNQYYNPRVLLCMCYVF